MVLDVVSGQQHCAPPRPRYSAQAVLGWLRTRDHWATTLVFTVYAALVLAGATTSSLGIAALRQDPAQPLGRQLFDPQLIRSDEYTVFSPINLSIMSTGGSPTLSPLAAQADVVHRYSSGGFFETVVFFDSTLLRSARVLPEAMVFAAHWWLPVLLLLVFLPRWFAQVGASRRMGWLAALLIVVSPSVAWWSLQPVQQLAYTVTGVSLLVSCYRSGVRREHGRAVLLGGLAGVCIAGMPSGYVPWSLVLGGTVLAATTAWVLTRQSSWWERLMPLALVAAVALIFGLGVLWENRDGLRALLGTVYPGARRSSGVAAVLPFLFGAPGLGGMQRTAPSFANASEFSTSFTVAFVWAFVLVVGSRWSRPWRAAVVPATVGAFGVLWLSWTTVDTGLRGAEIPLLNLVTPVRDAQVVGILGLLLVALLLSTVSEGRSWRTALGAGLGCGAVTIYAVSDLKVTALHGMRVLEVVLVSAAVAVAVTLVTRYPRRTWPVLLIASFAVLPVYRANPLIFGLGDLRESTTARTMAALGSAARADHTLWVTDDSSFAVVMLANGVPSLSALQRSGPNRAAWAELDPPGAAEQAWNRGGGFITFSFAANQPLTITSNDTDVIDVRTDPCTLARRAPTVTHLASHEIQVGPCVRPAGTVTWSGQPINLYDLFAH